MRAGAHVRAACVLLAVLAAAAIVHARTGDGSPRVALVTPVAAAVAAPDPAAAPSDGLLAGVPLQRARCRNWRAADAAQRAGAVRALRATVGGPSTSGGVGTTLADDQAIALFDRVCASPQTSGFALYLIYARAAAFSGRLTAR